MGPRQLNLTLHINERCNLSCRYCYITQKPKAMSLEVAKKAVDWALERGYPETIISFTTAEPLLDLPLVKQVVRYARRRGVRRFDLATNGTLLDAPTLRYCQDNNVVLQISYDGSTPAHDRLRCSRSITSVSRLVEKKLELVQRWYRLHLELRITFTPRTVPFLSRTVRWLVEKQVSRDMRINMVPVVHRTVWTEKDFAVLRREVFACADLFLEYYRRGKKLNLCASECLPLPYHFLSIYRNRDRQEMFCNTGYSILSVDAEGRIWPCYWLGASRFARKDRLCLGSIFEPVFDKARLEGFVPIRRNPFLSCRAWNYLVNRDSGQAVKVYRRYFSCWLAASKYVHSSSEVKV